MLSGDTDIKRGHQHQAWTQILSGNTKFKRGECHQAGRKILNGGTNIKRGTQIVILSRGINTKVIYSKWGCKYKAGTHIDKGQVHSFYWFVLNTGYRNNPPDTSTKVIYSLLLYNKSVV